MLEIVRDKFSDLTMLESNLKLQVAKQGKVGIAHRPAVKNRILRRTVDLHGIPMTR
jgi:hypothetical protein